MNVKKNLPDWIVRVYIDESVYSLYNKFKDLLKMVEYTTQDELYEEIYNYVDTILTIPYMHEKMGFPKEINDQESLDNYMKKIDYFQENILKLQIKNLIKEKVISGVLK